MTMGSRPTRVHSVDVAQTEGANGTVSKVTVNQVSELQLENTRLKKRLADLDKYDPDSLIHENERLKKQNEDLRNELSKMKQCSYDMSTNSFPVPGKISSEVSFRHENGLSHDVLSDLAFTPSPNTDRRILSDRSSSPGGSSCKTSPNVNDGRRRKIDPSSVFQRMSDIDAYGQGLPLADSSLMVRHARRTRRKKQMTKQASTAKDDSPTNSDGTASPAEVLPSEVRITHHEMKSGEEGPIDSGINSTDLDQLHGADQGQDQEPNDILMT